MKIGLIARAEDRGLAHVTWDFYRAMKPDRTLIVDMGLLARQHFPIHAERYPDAPLVPFDGSRFGVDMRPWLDGLDVVYTAETFYDPTFVPLCDEMGVATVCHVMPEFFKWATEPKLPVPTSWWNPTCWRRDVLPNTVRYVPVPVPLDPPSPLREPRPPDETTFVHVLGHQAMRDRNGTIALFRALRFVREPMRVRIVTQDPRLPGESGWGPRVDVQLITGGVHDRWDLYRDADVIVMPRRFGGLCLPVQEAMACGVVPMMSSCSPNQEEWPIISLRAVERGGIETGGGRVPTFDVDPRIIARHMDSWCVTPHEERRTYQALAARWVEAHTWNALEGLYRVELELACSARLTGSR